MTTKVIIDTHAGWPVSVETSNYQIVVPPGTKHEIYIHDGLKITLIEELKKKELPNA